MTMTSHIRQTAIVLLFLARGSGKLLVMSPSFPTREITTNHRDSVTVPSNADVTLQCTGGDVSPVTHFLYKGEPNIHNSLIMPMKPLIYNIGHVSFPLHSDIVYGCATLLGGGGFSMTLIVLAPPVVTNVPVTELIVGLGVNITLDCFAYGNPDPSISFLLGEQTVTPTSAAVIENVTISTRTVHLVKSSMEATISSPELYGNYTCLVSNTQGNWTGTSVVRPLSLPHITRVTQLSKVVKVGSTFSLSCSATGTPLPRIVWVLPRGASNASYNVTDRGLVTESRLDRYSAGYEDSGRYGCVAMTGHFFQDHAGTVVKVAGQPNSPTNVSISNVTSTSVVVKFSLGFDGKSRIFSSSIQLTEAESSEHRVITTNGNTTFAVLDELRPYSVYSVFVYSTNAIGKSYNSDTVNFTTDTAAPVGVPSGLNVSQVNSTSVYVRFNDIPETSWNSPSRGYVVRYGSSNYTIQLDRQPRVNFSVLVFDLKAYTSYEISVAAFNTKGLGYFSPHVRATTNEDRPGAPPEQVTIITLASRFVLVQHNAPDQDHVNGILLGFYIEVRDGDLGSVVFNATVVATRLRTNITRLKPFMTYSVQVAAFTRPGIGPWSSPVSFQTDEEKSGPPMLSLRHADISSVALQWLPPLFPNGNVSQYNITYQKELDSLGSSNLVHAVPSVAIQNTTIYRLTPETNYTFIVYAINGKGLGQASNYLQVATLSGVMGSMSQASSASTRVQMTMPPSNFHDSTKVMLTNAATSIPTSVTSEISGGPDVIVISAIVVVVVVALVVLVALLVWYRRRWQRKRRMSFTPTMTFQNRSSDKDKERYSKDVTAMTDTPNELRNPYVHDTSRASNLYDDTYRDSGVQLIPESPQDDSAFEGSDGLRTMPRPPLANRPSKADISSVLTKQRASASSEAPSPDCSDKESEYEHPYSNPFNSRTQKGKKPSLKVKHDQDVDNEKMNAGGTENRMVLNLPASLKGKPAELRSDYVQPQDACNNEEAYAFPQDAVNGVVGDGTTVEAYEQVDFSSQVHPVARDGGKKRSFFRKLLGGKKKKQRSKSSSAAKADSSGEKATRPGVVQPDIRGRSQSVPGRRHSMEAVDEDPEYELVQAPRPSSCTRRGYTGEGSGDHLYALVNTDRTYAQLELSKSQEIRDKVGHQYTHLESRQEQSLQVVESKDSDSVSDSVRQEEVAEFPNDGDDESIDGSNYCDCDSVSGNNSSGIAEPLQSSHPATYSSVDLDKRNRLRQEKAERQASVEAAAQRAQEKVKDTEFDLGENASSSMTVQTSSPVYTEVNPSRVLRPDQREVQQLDNSNADVPVNAVLS